METPLPRAAGDGVHDRALGGPPLGLLVAVAQGRVTPDMREVLAID